MTDLREQLLKAGLVSQQAAEKAAQETERRAGGRGGRAPRPDTGGGPPQRWRESAATEPLDDDASQARVAALVEAGRVDAGRGSRRWYYEARDGTVPWIEVGKDAAAQLEKGAIALVERDDGAAFLITSAAARDVAAIDPRWIRVFNA